MCACAVCCVCCCCCCLLLQSELVKAQEEAGALREGSSDLVSLQAQLAAAQEEASVRRDNSEEVEYLQAQLRRTLRQVVELQRQVRVRAAGWRKGSLGTGLCAESCDMLRSMQQALAECCVQAVERIERVLLSCWLLLVHLVRTGPAAAEGAFL